MRAHISYRIYSTISTKNDFCTKKSTRIPTYVGPGTKSTRTVRFYDWVILVTPILEEHAPNWVMARSMTQSFATKACLSS